MRLSNKRIAKTLNFCGGFMFTVGLLSSVIIVAIQNINISWQSLLMVMGILISSVSSSFVLFAVSRILQIVNGMPQIQPETKVINYQDSPVQ